MLNVETRGKNQKIYALEPNDLLGIFTKVHKGFKTRFAPKIVSFMVLFSPSCYIFCVTQKKVLWTRRRKNLYFSSEHKNISTENGQQKGTILNIILRSRDKISPKMAPFDVLFLAQDLHWLLDRMPLLKMLLDNGAKGATAGSGVGQLGPVGSRPYHQGAGWTQYKKTIGQSPVNLGGASILPKRRGCTAPQKWPQRLSQARVSVLMLLLLSNSFANFYGRLSIG